MKIIEKIVRVRKELDGEVWVNGQAKFTHSMSKDKSFIDISEANAFADAENDDHNIDEFREDFENDLRYAECDAEITSNDVDIDEYSIDECVANGGCNNWMLKEVLETNPNYEVKEMKYEIDGVKSTKNVLVEKALEEK